MAGADFIIINTCAVTRTAIRKAEKMILCAQKENPDSELFIIGCWPEVYRQDVEKKFCANIFGVAETDKIIDIFKEKIQTKNIVKKNNASVSEVVNRARYTVKIQDGCEQFCSYCIIPYTRGKLRSREEADIIREVENVIKNGYKEIVLSGIHLGLYGVNGGTALLLLLEKLVRLPGLGRIRLSSIEVREVSSALIDLIADTDKLCNHLHIPLQSGCDKILKLMNRPYDLKYFVDKIKEIRKKIPLASITTDVIVGFPGETNDDFDKTLAFVKKMKFSRLHVFPFSAHERTPAAKMENKLSREVIKKRADALRKLGNVLKKKYEKQFDNMPVAIVLENKKHGFYSGKSEYYVSYKFSSEEFKDKNCQVGDIILGVI
jgi:threonylcarbamoyladenosine tRNA methylthiotransferase MtaB